MPFVSAGRNGALWMEVIMIAICAVICGAETWVDIDNFGKAWLEWHKKFLKLSKEKLVKGNLQAKSLQSGWG